MAADMTALPFAAGAFDAVVVIDALHHVPDVPAVFREAHRVLVEAGSSSSRSPARATRRAEKSRAEMAEHGVCEGEIHLFEAMRYARGGGIRRRAGWCPIRARRST